METQSTEAVEDSNYISSDTTEEHTTRSEQNTRKQFQNSTRIVPKNRHQNGSTKNKDAEADEAYNIMTTMYNMGEFDAPPAQYRRETMEPGCYDTYQSPPSHSSFTTSEATQEEEMASFLQQ
ncbi:hypothetical protein JTB14_027583 [Gonioctena quinquepunctata]|nr:hypothetical protein JTB14_027583 [Gonioctena quinquepunctata]